MQGNDIDSVFYLQPSLESEQLQFKYNLRRKLSYLSKMHFMGSFASGLEISVVWILQPCNYGQYF